ncbi:MAG: flagellar basal body P-ring formation chaperone FlgA [Pseudomonadota bacterium]
MTRIKALLTAVLILLAAQATPALGEITVRAEPEVLVRGPRVFLGDVSEITGEDQELTQKLSRLELARSPRPGNTSHIRQSLIESLLRRNGFPLDQIALHLPEKIIITRESQTLTAAWVRGIVEQFIGQTEPYQGRDWELVRLWTGRFPETPAGKLAYNIVNTPSVNPTKLRLTIFLTVDGRDEGKITANCQVDIKTAAVTAARRLEAGQTIGPGDLSSAKVSLAKIRPGALTSPEQGLGLTVRQRINPGEPILDQDLQEGKAVKKGDMVTLIARDGFLKVASPGQVKQDAALGETVSVLNLSSKKVVLGKVIDSGSVEVSF